MPHTTTYEFGPFRFNSAGFLTRQNRPVHLTPKEARVLLVLLENAGAVVEKKVFWEKLWSDIREEVELDNCLKRAIATLRKALGESKNKSQYIVTLSKRGYLLGEDVRLISKGQLSSTKKLILLSFLFQSLSRSKQPESFIDGLTYEIITQLGRLNPGELGVIAPISAMRYKNTKKRIRQVGKELGVSYLLEGAALQSGNKVRISVQLIYVPDESQLWAELTNGNWMTFWCFCGKYARTSHVKQRSSLFPMNKPGSIIWRR